jgi:hypothetical protein
MVESPFARNMTLLLLAHKSKLLQNTVPIEEQWI